MYRRNDARRANANCGGGALTGGIKVKLIFIFPFFFSRTPRELSFFSPVKTHNTTHNRETHTSALHKPAGPNQLASSSARGISDGPSLSPLLLITSTLESASTTTKTISVWSFHREVTYAAPVHSSSWCFDIQLIISIFSVANSLSNRENNFQPKASPHLGY